MKFLFDYDNKADLKIREIGVEKLGDVTICDITFAGIPGGDDAKAYLVEPAGSGLFAGIYGYTGSVRKRLTGLNTWMKL